MISQSHNLAVFAVIAVGILPAATAQPAPLYPYVQQQDRPYAMQVAPNIYVMQGPSRTRDYPYVRCVNCNDHADRPHKPVMERKSYVDDPPRLIERKRIVEGEPARAKCKHGIIENCDTGSRVSGDDGKKRVIDADAEITILGPDRMSIRLFRKEHAPSAKSSDGE